MIIYNQSKFISVIEFEAKDYINLLKSMLEELETLENVWDIVIFRRDDLITGCIYYAE